MDLMVSGYGNVVSTKTVGDTARFTLRVGKNRYFVTVAGAEQCAVVASAERNGSDLFVVGRLFSFVHNGCAQHHCGIDAIIVVPAYGESQFGLVERQLISNQLRANGKATSLV